MKRWLDDGRREGWLDTRTEMEGWRDGCMEGEMERQMMMDNGWLKRQVDGEM